MPQTRSHIQFVSQYRSSSSKDMRWQRYATERESSLNNRLRQTTNKRFRNAHVGVEEHFHLLDGFHRNGWIRPCGQLSHRRTHAGVRVTGLLTRSTIHFHPDGPIPNAIPPAAVSEAADTVKNFANFALIVDIYTIDYWDGDSPF